MELKKEFKLYMEEAIGQQNACIAFSAFEQPASVSVRKNPFKVAAVPELSGELVPWAEYGLLLDRRPQFTLDPCFHAGGYYVQDSSSMFVGHAFRKFLRDYPLPEGRPLRVLDLCAAPGGKTTDIAASLRLFCGDNFLLVANEVMKQRVSVLADNVAIWGDPNVIVTSDDPSAFSALGGFFDIIVADVPCSGEGMFRKDEEALRQWSVDNVALCESRQRRIVADVWPALLEGGLMVYSTCTFNRYENDLNVKWIAGELGACVLTDKDVCGAEGVFKTESGYSLIPGLVPGEGQYCAVLEKTSSSGRTAKKSRNGKTVTVKTYASLFDRDTVAWGRGDLLIVLPETVYEDASFLAGYLHPVLSGCAAGTLKRDILVPSSDLALSYMYSKDSYPVVEVDRDTALAYLHRDVIVLADAGKGYNLLEYNALPLGFVKNLGPRCNNLHPQARRIRMDIK